MAGTKRTGRIGAVEFEDGTVEVNQDELLQVMSDIAGTLRQVGGMFAVTADRMQVDETGEGRTVGYLWSWQAFSPMRKPAREDEQQMPHEEPEVPSEAIQVPVEA